MLTDPKIYIEDIDFGKGVAKCHDMARQDYVDSSFLDYRTESTRGPYELQAQTILDELGDTPMPTKPMVFIFHLAFGGSTLLSRCLDQAGVCLSYKEPYLLHKLAFHYRAEWGGPNNLSPKKAMALTLNLLGRTFHPSEVPLIKPTDSCNNLIRPILETLPKAKALLLYTKLEPFAVSMLKHKNRRTYLRESLPRAKSDFKAMGINFQTQDLTDGEIVGYLWLSQMVQFSKLLQDKSLSIKSLNATKFFNQPTETLMAVSKFFNLNHHPKHFETQVREGAFTKDSKDLTANYDPQVEVLKRQRYSDSHASEIAIAKDWIEKRINKIDLLNTLPHSVLEGDK